MRAAAVLIALPGLALAGGVSLSEFKPFLSGLSKNCEGLYDSDLPGCTATDFTTRHCSNSCLSTLQTITHVIRDVCGNENLQGVNIISAFLDGNGASKICVNAPAGSGSSGSSASSSPSSQQALQTASTQAAASTSATQLSSPALASTSAPSSGASVATSATSAIAPTSSNPPSGIDVDTSASPTAQSTTTSAASTTQNIGHGGSPFDLSNNTSGAGRCSVSITAGIAAAFAMTLLCSLII